MKLEGRISILISRDSTTIEIEDDKASIKFVSVKLTPEQLSACLSRQALVPCVLDVIGLDKIGKTHENTYFEFEIPKELADSSHSDELAKIAQGLLDKDGSEWIADSYFGSQNTFFSKGEKQYARCTVRRWI